MRSQSSIIRLFATLFMVTVTIGLTTIGNAQDISATLEPQMYLPALQSSGIDSSLNPGPGDDLDPTNIPTDWLGRVNYYRGVAGLSPVTEDATLNNQCLLHAQYMAERNHLTHQQSPGAYNTPAGQICAGKGNAWLGSAYFMPIWQVEDSIDSWASSVGHRLWMLYPTTPTFGYGFYTDSETNRAGGALDVLSTFNSAADTAYTGWPVRYPAPDQGGIPAEAYPITLHWRYFGATPSISSTSLRIDGGAAIGHTAINSLPSNHKGIQIIPNGALPDNTVFVVTVVGTYDGAPFTYTWRFSTGDTNLSVASTQDATKSIGDSPVPEGD